MKKSNELDVRGTLVRVIKIGGDDYVCLTDMAKRELAKIDYHPIER